MKRIWRSIVGGCLAAAIASAPGPLGSTGQAARTPAAEPVLAGDAFSKLKKVHLVRPDLISYPLLNEYVC